MPGTNQKMAAARKRPMVPGAGCAGMCTRRRPVCCVCSGTVCSIVLGCPFRFYCRAAHSAANGDRSGATTAPTLCLAAPLAAARPTRIQRPRRWHRRDAARYDHSRPRPASLSLSSATLPATPLSGSTAARPVRSGGGRRSVMRCGREGRADCAPRGAHVARASRREEGPLRACGCVCPRLFQPVSCVSTIVCSCSARGITYWRGLQCAACHLGLRG